MLSAIIVAAGRSRRAGFDKIFADLAGRPLIAHTVAAFQHAPSVDEVILVGRESILDSLRALTAHFPKIRTVLCGGERRQDSVQRGLNAILEVEFVAVHDAARPLITPSEIERVFSAAKEYGAAALAAPVTDTLKVADAEGYVIGSIDRQHVFTMQTPQIFARQLLIEAYDRLRDTGLTVTDEVSAVEHAGGNVAVVVTQDHNPKMTFASDLLIAEFILSRREKN
jgi:2-C-methyl-D-erythritol 4-phosphate cytidylyltransferase